MIELSLPLKFTPRLLKIYKRLPNLLLPPPPPKPIFHFTVSMSTNLFLKAAQKFLIVYFLHVLSSDTSLGTIRN